MAGSWQGKWIRRSEAEWRSLASRFEASGLGVRAFCRREAVSAASFYRWQRLLSDERDSHVDRGTVPAFVDLGVLNSTVPAARPRIDLTLDLGDGLILHLVRH
jgi:hypothetical protein